MLRHAASCWLRVPPFSESGTGFKIEKFIGESFCLPNRSESRFASHRAATAPRGTPPQHTNKRVAREAQTSHQGRHSCPIAVPRRGGCWVGLGWVSACAKGGDPRPVCPYLTGSTGYPPLVGLTAVQTADDPRTPPRRWWEGDVAVPVCPRALGSLGGGGGAFKAGAGGGGVMQGISGKPS